MKAEITGSGDELVITLDMADLPDPGSDASLRRVLPSSAGGIADGILGMIGAPPEAGSPRKIRIIHVRLVRTAVIAETTLALDAEREVWT